MTTHRLRYRFPWSRRWSLVGYSSREKGVSFLNSFIDPKLSMHFHGFLFPYMPYCLVVSMLIPTIDLKQLSAGLCSLIGGLGTAVPALQICNNSEKKEAKGSAKVHMRDNRSRKGGG